MTFPNFVSRCVIIIRTPDEDTEEDHSNQFQRLPLKVSSSNPSDSPTSHFLSIRPLQFDPAKYLSTTEALNHY